MNKSDDLLKMTDELFTIGEVFNLRLTGITSTLARYLTKDMRFAAEEITLPLSFIEKLLEVINGVSK